MAIDRLFVPTPRFINGRVGWNKLSKSACQWLRGRLQAQAKKKSKLWGKTPRYVYISRNDARQRQVENEAELIKSLNQFGFRKYQLTRLSILDQVSLFFNADIVVAPHGAGLTNIIYSDNLSVVELFGDPETNVAKGPHFYLLSNILEFDYQYIVCESNDKNIRANPRLITKVIETIGSGESLDGDGFVR